MLVAFVALICGLSILQTTFGQCPAQFGLASYYASNMVLQGPPARPRIWGYAPAVGAQVILNLNTGTPQTVVVNAANGPAGRPVWEAEFNPIMTEGPHTITVQTGSNCVITLSNILIGDVYLCSGQSNMCHRLDNIDNPAEEVNQVPNFPNIRTFQTALMTADSPQHDLLGITRNWAVGTTGNMPGFSAVCWLFAKNLFQRYGRPLGMVQTCWGGTRVEAWSSPQALSQCFTSVPPATGANAASVLYNAMIHPFIPMPIFGAIWYQGESNQGNAAQYNCAITAMVNDWRASWKARNPSMDAAFPFGQVQLAPDRDQNIVNGFADVRWYQTDALGYTPNNRMNKFFLAVAIDLPDFGSPYGSIHPRYKRQIASRLALAAANVAYGTTGTGIYQGPLPTGFSIDGSNVRVRYGVALRYGVTSSIFELCCGASATQTCGGAGGTWVVSNFVQGNTMDVLISNPCNVALPVVTGFRYLWRESPCRTLEQCPIYSVENSLPAPPYVFNGVITREAAVELKPDIDF